MAQSMPGMGMTGQNDRIAPKRQGRSMKQLAYSALAAFILLLTAPAVAVAQDGVLAPAERPIWDIPSPTPPTAQDDTWTDTAPPPTRAAPTPAPAPVQMTLPGPAPAFDPSAIDLSEVPEIVLRDMDQVVKNCRMNYFYSRFHDCECIGVKFLDARLAGDPSRSRDAIFNSVANQCPNELEIAGFIYTSCVDFMRNRRPDTFESFCTCTANAVATRYTRAPRANMRYIENIRKQAYLDCGLGNR